MRLGIFDLIRKGVHLPYRWKPCGNQQRSRELRQKELAVRQVGERRRERRHTDDAGEHGHANGVYPDLYIEKLLKSIIADRSDFSKYMPSPLGCAKGSSTKSRPKSPYEYSYGFTDIRKSPDF